MATVTWILITNIIVWAGIGGYILYLGIEQKRISKTLQQIKVWKDE